MAVNPELPDHSVGNKKPRNILAVKNPDTEKYREVEGREGQLVLFGVDVAEGKMKVSRTPMPPFEEVYTQLTAPGNTAWVDLAKYYTDFTLNITVASINASVLVGLQAQNVSESEEYFILPVEGGDQANLSLSAGIATISANGTYYLRYIGRYHKVRAVFGGELEGTDATVNFEIIAGARNL